MADTRIILRIDQKTRNRVKRAARLRGVSESQVVREAIENQLAAGSHATAYDRVKQARAIGVARGLPADLSADSRHFEGFGR